MSIPIEFPKLPTRVDTPICCEGCPDPWYVEPCPMPSVFFPIRACCPSCKREILFPDFEAAADNLSTLVSRKSLTVDENDFHQELNHEI
jgi:hypothetical protein